MKDKVINFEEFKSRDKNTNDYLDDISLDMITNPTWDDFEELLENDKDNKIVLDDISTQKLLRKIEHDKKNPTLIKDNNIEEKLEEGKKLLKQLFGEKEDIFYEGYNVNRIFADKEYRQQVFEHYDSKYERTQSKCTNKYKESLKNMTKEDLLAFEELLNE